METFSLVLFSFSFIPSKDRGYSTEAVEFIREYECGLKSVTKELLHFIQTATSRFPRHFQTSHISHVNLKCAMSAWIVYNYYPKLPQLLLFNLCLFPESFDTYTVKDAWIIVLIFIQVSWVFQRFIAKLSYRIFINNWDQNVNVLLLICVGFFCFPTQTLHCAWTKVAVDMNYLEWLSHLLILALVNQNNWRDLLLQGFLAVIKNCLRSNYSCLGTKSA